MGIFPKKPGDFGSMFGRQKKERMTSKENEDEQSLMSLSKEHNTKPSRKTTRKQKINTKFRRLREEWQEPGTPQYEPPQGIDFPGAKRHAPFDDEPDCFVPDAIDISVSACDTLSTLEGSLVDILRKERAKTKHNERATQEPGKQPLKSSSDTRGWLLHFTDKSFGDADNSKHVETKPAKEARKDKNLVEPKFYALEESPSIDGSCAFQMPTFSDPFSDNGEQNIQFTCSEEYENDENVEKVSAAGSDDFHQFVVSKLKVSAPPSNLGVEKKETTRDKSIMKAAESIAVSLSTSSPQISRRRMIATSSTTTRSRKVLGEKKSLRTSTPTRLSKSMQQKNVSIEPPRFHQSYSSQSSREHSKGGTKSCSVCSASQPKSLTQKNSSDDSLQRNLVQDPNGREDFEASASKEPQDAFHIGTFSHPNDPVWSPCSETLQHRSTSNFGSLAGQVPSMDDARQSSASQNDLIDIIRISSQRSEDGSSKKPDPSPKYSKAFDISPKSPSRHSANQPSACFGKQNSPQKSAFNKATLSRPKRQVEGSEINREEIYHPENPNLQNVLLTQSSSSGPSHSTLPSGIPANAILASMLFRGTHSESTMALPGERGRLSDPFKEEESHEMPLELELDLMEQHTVSSVTEDAGSFYHDNFEKWNTRAHRALNNLYSTYHNASTKLSQTKRGTCGTVNEAALFDA